MNSKSERSRNYFPRYVSCHGIEIEFMPLVTITERFKLSLQEATKLVNCNTVRRRIDHVVARFWPADFRRDLYTVVTNKVLAKNPQAHAAPAADMAAIKDIITWTQERGPLNQTEEDRQWELRFVDTVRIKLNSDRFVKKTRGMTEADKEARKKEKEEKKKRTMKQKSDKNKKKNK